MPTILCSVDIDTTDIIKECVDDPSIIEDAVEILAKSRNNPTDYIRWEAVQCLLAKGSDYHKNNAGLAKIQQMIDLYESLDSIDRELATNELRRIGACK